MVLNFYRQDRSRLLTNFYLPKGVGPPVGTNIHVIIEIRLDGQPHEISHGLQATTGPMSDFDEACGVGLRIEWKDPQSQWMQEYVQMRQQYNRHDTGKPPGRTQGYLRSTGFRAMLLQEHRGLHHLFPWISDYGIAKVKKITIEHLTQTIKSELLATTGNARPTPLYYQDERAQAQTMQALGAQQTALSSQPNYPPVGANFRNSTRKVKCDWCHYSQVIAGRAEKDCVKVDGKSICGNCTKQGRPCHYTNATTMNASRALQRASFTTAESTRGPQRCVPRLLIQY
ncbi:hypothetical protein CKM354_000918300 [Cercospora kikuchii]|nr:uncharacterized protein CKM354_000918300 [Cercospora kikuchii]GIZ46042.1 hypothetical protein CKM354_000918300 [Cercospora kikuchii]